MVTSSLTVLTVAMGVLNMWVFLLFSLSFLQPAGILRNFALCLTILFLFCCFNSPKPTHSGGYFEMFGSLCSAVFFFLSPPVSYLVRDPNFGFFYRLFRHRIFSDVAVFFLSYPMDIKTVVGNAMAKSKDISDGASLDLFLNGNHVDWLAGRRFRLHGIMFIGHPGPVPPADSTLRQRRSLLYQVTKQKITDSKELVTTAMMAAAAVATAPVWGAIL